ncbi:MAG: YlxR family protein [Firmicutes bacterium]|nr:YlxR family protein [Bacillota bacterium]
MQSFPKASLIRITAGEGGLIINDAKAPGRGVYLCCKAECVLIAAKKNAVARGLKRAVSRAEMDRLTEEITRLSSMK